MLRKTVAIATSAALLLALTACGSGDSKLTASAGTPEDPIVIGVVGASDPEWKLFAEKAASAGISIELKDFTEYSLPNPALTEGDLDLNQFQHIKYLAEYNASTGKDLTPIAATAIYPLGLYSKKWTSIDEIPAGAEIAIPNDPSNLARGLLVLQGVGLIALKDGGTIYSTEADVLPESKVKVTPVDAAQTAVALNSVDGSVINNDFIADAGLDPADALYEDDAASEAARPYINIWVSRAADKGNENFAKLVALYKEQDIQDAVVAKSGDTAVLANNTGAELEGYLKDVVEQAAALKK